MKPDLANVYGREELFGGFVGGEFPDAQDDLMHAGNCLALGESTACVLHLMRAMEAAVRRLAKKLQVTIDPKDTWGQMLHAIDNGIKALPEKTTHQKKRKDMWSECRVNLFHVKQAWRDSTMHGRRSYTDNEAISIMNAVQPFMDQLAYLCCTR